MRYNPCGRIVDIGRKTYKRSCRFLNDNDVVSTVRWKDARHDAETLGFESIILCTDYEPDKWLPAPVGEDVFAPYRFALGIAPNGSGRGHVCGTEEEFRNGGTYEPDLPPVRYSASGLPLCCAPILGVRGGAGGGGRSAYLVIDPIHCYGGAGGGGRSAYTCDGYIDAAEGGGEGGGEAGDVLEFIDAAEGGGEGGGEAGDVLDLVDATEGGGEGGGEAGDVLEFIDAAEGGGEGGGEAGDVLDLVDAAEGGGEGGGEAGDALEFIDAAEGGGEGGGAAGDVLGFIDAAEGGGEGGGAAGDVLGFIDATAGGGEGGGAAGDVFTPGGPTPGTSCATAGTIAPGQSFTGPLPGLGVTNWFVFVPTPFTGYTVTVSGVAPGGASTQIATGSCPFPSNFIGSIAGSGSQFFFVASAAPVYIWTSAPSAGTYTVSLT